jgi:hypothetical protein
MMANKYTDIVVVSDALAVSDTVAESLVFQLRLQAKPGTSPDAVIRALRAVLKTASRRHRLRCLSVHRERDAS